ncbi:MAG: hypothetical protein ACRDDX_16495 [Cellulosilyticaceae bacterium]
MLNNLKAEMMRYGIRAKDFAEALNKREATISSRMTGKTTFSVDEAIKLKQLYFPHLDIEYLFTETEYIGGRAHAINL